MAVTEKNNKFYMSDCVGIMHDTKAPGEIAYHKHYHDFVELVYTLRGKCVHTVDGVEYSVSHGDMIFINYGKSHSISGSGKVEYVNILIKPDYINLGLSNQENAFALLNLSEFEEFTKILDKTKCKITFSGEEREYIEEIIFAIDREIASRMPGYELALRSRLNLLFITLFRKMSLPIDEGIGGMNEKILAYIRQHSSEKITLEDVAKKCSYNPSYFSRIFKEYTGKTFSSYLSVVRMENAALLLETTSRSITDIYSSVGYTDKTKFFAHFREYYGTTPLKYRKSKK